MKWTIPIAIDSTIANSFLSRMHKSMGNLIIIIEKERLIREWSSQEKKIHLSKCTFINFSGTDRSIFYFLVSKSFFHRVARFDPHLFIPKIELYMLSKKSLIMARFP